MEELSSTPPEYVAARRTLLDALGALEYQIESLVLIGSQAIYLHTGPAGLTIAPTTTDADLALDPDLLADSPEIRHALEQAGFFAHDNPGHWGNARGIFVDLMVPPHVANRGPGARAARLPPHDRMTARIGPGLALCLTDNSPRTITSLDPDDAREHVLRVANPPALLVAKTFKVGERLEQGSAGRPSRIIDKDALDILRLLQTTDLLTFVHTMQAVPPGSAAQEDVDAALRMLAGLAGSPDSPLPVLARRASGDDPTVAASLFVLVDELLQAWRDRAVDEPHPVDP